MDGCLGGTQDVWPSCTSGEGVWDKSPPVSLVKAPKYAHLFAISSVVESWTGSWFLCFFFIVVSVNRPIKLRYAYGFPTPTDIKMAIFT